MVFCLNVFTANKYRIIKNYLVWEASGKWNQDQNLKSADQVCIRCQKRLIEGDQLNHVGSKFRDDQNKQHPTDAPISYAEKLKI